MKNLNYWIYTGKTIIMVFVLTLSETVISQTVTEGSLPQYLFSGFTTGNVKMKNGRSQTSVMNYNTVTEKMVYEKEGKLYDMVNLDMIDSVFLYKSIFVPVGKVFYEVIMNKKISFFIQHKGELLSPGAPAAYGGTSQVSSSKYMTSVELSSGYYNLKLPSDLVIKAEYVYWIRKDDNMYSFINERQFIKLFPGKESVFKQFIKQNRIKFDNLTDLVKLMEHCNELFQ
jgi:hypothetical protein